MRILGLYLSWLIALTALAGSFLFQYTQGVLPNTLSWYQRVCMEPLVLILGVASLKQYYKIVSYVMPQVILGAILAAAQIWLKMWPEGKGFVMTFCGVNQQCTEQVILSPQSIPVLSLLGFISIFILLVWCAKRNKYNWHKGD